MALKHTNSLSIKSITKGTLSKLSLGAASLMMLTVIGSAAMAGATPVTGTPKADDPTSLQKGQEQDNNKDGLKDHKDNNGQGMDHGQGQGMDHGKNQGHNGYGGGNNNAVKTDLKVNQSGHDNVLTVIINYIFG
jgi:uncharacterized protein involved in copper resistance